MTNNTEENCGNSKDEAGNVVTEVLEDVTLVEPTVRDINPLSKTAMENAYYICHNVQVVKLSKDD